MAYQETIQQPVSPVSRPAIASLDINQPLTWLSKGWQDLKKNPVIALGYGLLVAAVYGAIVASFAVTGYYHLGVQLTAGFILLAPLFAAGLYGISRAEERGESTSFSGAFKTWGRNTKGLLGMGFVLAVLYLAWFMISLYVTAVMAQGTQGLALLAGAESWGAFYEIVATQVSAGVMLAYLAVGLLGVLVTFAVSAVSLPLLVDRPETDTITALVSSWNTVLQNWKPMLLWAVLIALITGIGLALFYVGLIVTVPLLAFATWHAYRDTLGEWQEHRDPLQESE